MEKGSIKKSKYAPAGTGENAEVLRISIFPTADSALQEEGKSVPARPQIQQDVLPVNENDSGAGDGILGMRITVLPLVAPCLIVQVCRSSYMQWALR